MGRRQYGDVVAHQNVITNDEPAIAGDERILAKADSGSNSY